MPPRRAATSAKKPDEGASLPLLGADEVLAVLAAKESIELPPNLLLSVEALLGPPPAPPSPAATLKTPATRQSRSNRTPAASATASSLSKMRKTADAALQAPPAAAAAAQAPVKQETIRFCMQLINALLAMLASAAAVSASKEAVETLVEVGRGALRVLRRGLKGGERVGVEKACVGLAGRLGALGSKEAALSLLKESRPVVLGLYEHAAPSPDPPPASSTSKAAPAAVPQTPARRRVPSGTTSSATSVKLGAPAALPLVAPLPAPKASSAFPPATSNLLLSFSSALLAIIPHHPAAATILDLIFSQAPAIPSTALPPLLMPLVRALSSPPPTPTSTAHSILKSRSSALDVLQLVPTLKPTVYWDQLTRFVRSFLGKCSPAAAEYALASAEIAKRVAWTEDKTAEWRHGKDWDDVLQVWRTIASKAGEVETLDTILRLLDEGAPSTPSDTDGLVEGVRLLDIQSAATPPPSAPTPSRTLSRKGGINIPQALTVLTQVSMKLESHLKAPSTPYDLPAEVAPALAVLERVRGACPESDLSKVARAFERLRRACSKALENNAAEPSNKALTAILRGFVEFTESVIGAPIDEAAQGSVCDLVYSATDTLLLLARNGFAPIDRSTHATALAHIDRALRLVSSARLGSQDRAKLGRFISGTAYHLGGKIYKEGRAIDGLPLLRVSCEAARDALQDWVGAEAVRDDGAARAPKDDQWTMLAEDLGKRWELLGTVWLKKGDKQEAYRAYVEGLRSIPSSTIALVATHARSLSPAAIVALQAPPLVLLFSLLNRLTIVAHFDLGLPSSSISASCLLSLSQDAVHREAVALMVEYQLGLMGSAMGREGVGRLAQDLVANVDALYLLPMHPVRRLRLIAQKVRFLASNPIEGAVSLAALSEDIELCATAQDLGFDAQLAQFIPSLVGSSRLWLSLLAHAASAEPKDIVAFAQDGLRYLRIAFPISDALLGQEAVRTPVKRAALVENTRQAPPATARRRVVKVAATPKSPPKAPSRTPRAKPAAKPTAPAATRVDAEGLESILDLLDSTASVLGLLGEATTKIQALKLVWGLTSDLPQYLDVYVTACGVLGAEYAMLSKISRASHVFSSGLRALQHPQQGYTGSFEARTTFLLRQAMFLASENQLDESVSTYKAALEASQKIQYDAKLAGSARLKEKTARTERAALAHEVAAAIHQLKGDLAQAIVSLMHAHRLWNSAVRNVARLSPKAAPSPAASPAASPSPCNNPFQVDSAASAHPPAEQPSRDAVLASKKDDLSLARRVSSMAARTSEGLLSCMTMLASALVQRGSPREAEHLLHQLGELAQSSGSSTLAGRALGRRALLNLQMGKTDDAASLIDEARAALTQDQHRDLADLLSTEGLILELCDEPAAAQVNYDAALELVVGADRAFEAQDTVHPVTTATCAPEPIYLPLLANLLRQKALVLLSLSSQDGPGKRQSDSHAAFVSTAATLADDLSHDARQVLRIALEDFKSDLTMSSLTESSISIPMGYVVGSSARPSKARKEANLALARAETAFVKALEHNGACGRVQQVREACLSLSLLRALQTSMGQDSGPLAVKTTWCLDHCASITLRRELLEAIYNKTPRRLDSLSWPSLLDTPVADDRHAEEEDTEANKASVWQLIAARPPSSDLDGISPSVLPPNCCVVTINVSDDLTTLFVSRRSSDEEPIVFSLPLDRQGRREGEDEHFSFSDATDELTEIISKSNDTARNAKDVDSKQGKLDWWAERRSLDKRMEELLNNIEFCWLGAFKSIFNPPSKAGPEALTSFRTKIEDLFLRALASSKKSGPRVKIDDNLLGCFATLKPTSRDEELEDLVYFILDLFQVHGQAVALAEIDVDQLVVDLRTILEEQERQASSPASPPSAQRNIYLVLDRHCQPIPWESLPSLRGQSITRIPSTPFLEDRVLLQHHAQEEGSASPVENELSAAELRTAFSHQKGMYILNPSGDLSRTQKTFEPWTAKMNALGWTGIVGRPPSEEELVHALQTKDVVIYFGHGGADQYIQSRKIRHLRRCATVMLWGCSSGHLKDQGEFDRAGVPWHYMVAGCPSLVANLWDVTDRDIDRISEAVLKSMHLDGARAPDGSGLSTAQAVAGARTDCKLRFLTGAAPVVYGVPAWAV